MQRVNRTGIRNGRCGVSEHYSIGSEQPKYVLILSGDHIYKMNYGLMLEQHCQSGAAVTLATLPVDPSEVAGFGVVEVSRSGEVTGFEEKPKTTDKRSPFNPEKGGRQHGHLPLQY